MFEIGRVCMKIAGRDAGLKCIIIGHVDDKTVLIDGETRRRKCNVKHLEPMTQTVKISKDAPTTEVVRVFKELGVELKVSKAKKAKDRLKKSHARKEKPVKAPVEAKGKKAAASKKQEKEAVEKNE